MKKIFLLFLVSTLTFTSCSNNEKKGEEVAETQAAEEISIDDSDFVVDANEEFADLEEVADPTAEPTMEAVATNEEPVDEVLLQENVQLEKEVVVSKTDTYEVQKGETLMWIAFKLYGDYSKWRDVQAMNQEALADGLQPGDIIKYESGQFNWNPVGLPHLIRKGETLGVISKDKYGTPAKWRSIWDNNREMIKDPNLIFAGFTLYYIPEERDVASSPM
ncbi:MULTISPECIES: LysM peptidoglycan-binding domain-containing protein [Halobacteriovorax]|uniref:LysM peptidoglycan-binding domain-containing protein n=1 Tax=Halobacteriovorax vibrionivorans TaxID=2152716 RepID=A0ABY0INE6_9BACT|nr:MULTISPECIES: LysM peptidoglycan-binding domain-containing protein [Halobacteriovorax]AYF45975.1 LysM domain protein [Halobacteriovorax sp. BALOs_7]RZF23004.1 LysM peptidoglycan-binding domain-containing protein [Halobacteriovorax vibrionivorans]TGD46853.1 LysM peptidoglycan-binding domain-containing protein [Halobacteriovorax sp. Y22]